VEKSCTLLQLVLSAGQKDQIGCELQAGSGWSAARFRRGGVPCARRMHKEGEPRNSLASTLISVARFGKQLDFLLLDSMWN
jgi:hypothetical protein